MSEAVIGDEPALIFVRIEMIESNSVHGFSLSYA